MDAFWNAVNHHIRQRVGADFHGRPQGSIGGGCINDATRFGDDRHRFFVKRNRADLADMFAQEAEGLRQIAATQTITVPQPIAHGVFEHQSFLVLTWLDLSGSGAWSLMGERLAALHDCAVGDDFGWVADNTIGPTPQPNPREADWITFFIEHRLAHQVRLAKQNGASFPEFEALRDVIPAMIGDGVRPSLLHGDLWSGNAGFTVTGEPAIYDVACYWGDGETDVAMTYLFGGFGRDFYSGYRSVRPLRPGFSRRRDLYNLYHVLNHYNLFGGMYLQQARSLMRKLTHNQ